MGWFKEQVSVPNEMLEILKRYDDSLAVELFPGTKEAFEEYKGGQRYQYLETDRPEKYILGSINFADRNLETALSIREGKVYRYLGGRVTIRHNVTSYHLVNTARLRAYDLGADALVYYVRGTANPSGVPIKRAETNSNPTGLF